MSKQSKIALGFLIFAVAASAFFLLFRPEEEGRIAVVKQDGEIIREIDLDKLEEPLVFNVMGNHGIVNTVVAEPGRIRVKDATCPDRICVDKGWISRPGVPIVCLPNHLVIEILGEGGEVDAVS